MWWGNHFRSGVLSDLALDLAGMLGWCLYWPGWRALVSGWVVRKVHTNQNEWKDVLPGINNCLVAGKHFETELGFAWCERGREIERERERENLREGGWVTSLGLRLPSKNMKLELFRTEFPWCDLSLLILDLLQTEKRWQLLISRWDNRSGRKSWCNWCIIVHTNLRAHPCKQCLRKKLDHTCSWTSLFQCTR